MSIARCLVWLAVLTGLPAAAWSQERPVQFTIAESHPTFPGRLGVGDRLWIRLTFQTTLQVRFWAETYAGGQKISAGSSRNVAPPHPAGEGEVLIWISFHQPAAIDEIRIEACTSSSSPSCAGSRADRRSHDAKPPCVPRTPGKAGAAGRARLGRLRAAGLRSGAPSNRPSNQSANLLAPPGDQRGRGFDREDSVMTAIGLRVGAALIAGSTIMASFIAALGSATAETGRSVALVLDASGSMNARLPDGTARIDAAKSAIADLVGKLPGDTRLALRVYGHQSPTSAKNCQDTALLVGFGSVASNKSAVVAAARGIRAQGYTPITHVLKLAAQDLAKEEAASRVVVLVSDGRETCAADPCATAKALAEADARLVVHTIGLGVDAAARYQLQCIANVARGIYVGADSTAELAAALGKTAEAAPVRKTAEVAAGDKKGKIRIEGAPPASHEVIDAATGQRVASINTGHPSEVELPPGIYNVKFKNGLWMGIEVRPGATTKLRPGLLKVEGRDLWGNRFLDPETQESVGETTAGYDRVALLPTRVLVTFGNRHKAVWPEPVEIREGATTTLRPGGIEVRSASSKWFKAVIKGADGRFASDIGAGIHRIALPLGRYVLELDGRQTPVDLMEGQDVKIMLP
jgi:Mg-chelatase subunit ChlD